jgi:uncharacterized protein YgiM (DUF1202 family)
MNRAARSGTLFGLCLLLAACTSAKNHAAPPPPSTTSSSTSTTVPGVQTSGPRTVLSPIGINVRADPHRGAKVLGTAAQGVALTVLGHTGAAGGWYQVKGQTVTGWISADPTLSAPGEFTPYTSNQFNALYPATWTSTPYGPASVVFHSGSDPNNIVAIASSSTAKLPRGRVGYGEVGTSVVVVCGVTSALVTYQLASAVASTSTTVASSTSYRAEVRVTVDPHHALGFYAGLSALGSQLDVFRNFLSSVTFSSKQCTG